MSELELLQAWCVAVEEGGGVFLDTDDEEEVLCYLRSDAGLWRHGAAYLETCNKIGRAPVVYVPGRLPMEEWDGQDALDAWNRAKEEGRVRS